MGNFFLACTILSITLLFMLTSLSPGVGDRGMSYSIGFFICLVLLIISTGPLFFYLGNQNKLGWMVGQNDLRFLTLFASWALFAGTIFFMSAFRNDWNETEVMPIYLRKMALAYATIWISLLILIPIFWSINYYKEGVVPPGWIKYSMFVGYSFCLLTFLGLGIGYTKANSIRRHLTETQAPVVGSESYELNKINSHQLTDPITDVLYYSGPAQDRKIRNAAVAKAKQHPGWEEEIIRLLNGTQGTYEIIEFLSANKVDHPEKFPDALNAAIRNKAEKIKNSDSYIQADDKFQFLNENIPKLLRALDKQFILPGVDYRPALMELSEALESRKVPYSQKPVIIYDSERIKEWIMKH